MNVWNMHVIFSVLVCFGCIIVLCLLGNPITYICGGERIGVFTAMGECYDFLNAIYIVLNAISNTSL